MEIFQIIKEKLSTILKKQFLAISSSVTTARIGMRIDKRELIKKERSPRYTKQWGELLKVRSN